MAVSMTIELEGYAALTKAFNSLNAKLQTRFLRPALREGAKVMLKAVKRAAPRSDEAPHMDATLKIKAMKRKRGRVGFLVITGKRHELGIRDYTDAEKGILAQLRAGKTVKMSDIARTRSRKKGRFATETTPLARNAKIRVGPGYYPAHIEYGYRRPNGTRVPANPWMKRGLEEGRAEATETIAQELSRRLKASVGLENLSDAEVFGGPDVEVTV